MSRWRARSPRELADRAGQAFHVMLERAGLGPSPASPAAGSLLPALPFPPLSGKELGVVYGARPLERAAVIEHADAVLAGRFHLLGFRSLDFGTPPDWHSDPTRSRRAPDRHWSRVPYLDESVVGDHKIVWELNRHQWLVTLAQAWRLTDDPRYLEAIAQSLRQWLDANPPRRGINWASSLELAFRAIAWTWTLHLTGNAMPDADRLLPRVHAGLELHGLQIERFLSTWFSPNTHLTGEALGLLYLGTAWPSVRHAERWRTAGWRILLEQLPVQVRRDGTYFEQTTWYQGYTTDFYLHALLLVRAARLAVPAWAEERIARAAEVVANLRRPDGTLPLIGDDDGGRALPLDPVRTSFHDTAALAAAVLDRPDSCFGGVVPAGTAWIVGSGTWRALSGASAQGPAPASRAFRDGGWYLLRGTEGCLIVDAGPHGVQSAGHSHADALSLDLTVGGKPVVVDPGTGSYVGPWRDRFRATVAHNTLSLAGGIGSAIPAGPFQWNRWPRTVLRHWSAGPEWTVFEAEHDGYSRVIPGLLHRRSVVFRQGWGWLVLDRLVGEGSAATVRFQLDAGLLPSMAGHAVSVTDASGTPLIRISGDGAGRMTTEAGLVSRCYGVAEAAPAIVRQITAEESRNGVATLIAPDPTAQILRAPDSEAAGWCWQLGRESVRLRVGTGGVTLLETGDLTLTLN